MKFIELHQFRCDLPILINVENICSIEQDVDFTCICVGSNRYYVTESYERVINTIFELAEGGF